MLELPRTLISFAVVLGVLVFFHELGHYLAARWAGIKVEVFSIGFGPKLIAWTDKHGTEWRVCVLPLGGYVKMHGMEQPEEIPEAERAIWTQGQTFHGKSIGARAVVIAAGPVANFLLAIVLFFGLFVSVGRSYITPSVLEVVKGGAAAKAGIESGDLITAINGVNIKQFEDLQKIVGASAGKPLQLTVERKQHLITMPVVPVASGGSAIIGIRGGGVAFEHLPLGSALVDSVTETYQIGRDDLAGIGKIFSGAASPSDLSGTIGIAQLSGEAAKAGLPTLINFIAFISVNLGLINLFPIPVLDGGHLLFLATEAVRRKPLSPRIQGMAMYVGLTLIVMLMLLGARNDLGRLGLFQWAGHFF